MKKVLITGASGFVGGYLAELLLSLGEYEIYGTYTSPESLERSPIKDKIHFVQVDLQKKEQIFAALEQSTPEHIYHLVGQANAAMSITDPRDTFRINVDSQINLFEILREKKMTPRVLVAGSGEEYGHVQGDELPIVETTPLRPANPYAVSKITQDFLGFQYHLAYNIPVIRTRPFNHIGPRQKEGFVTADFAKQIALIEKGKQEPLIRVGNLEAKRDFTDVRDTVRAYQLLLEKGEAGEVYNIGSGTAYKIRDVLDMMIALSSVPIKEEVDQTKLRPSDVPEIRADHAKLTSITDWKPEVAFEQTIKDILEYWRGQV